MIKSFITAFKLKNTYRVNSIIYSIKQIPIIKKILPDSLYKSKALKIIGNIISIIIEILSFFVGKFLYILFMIFFMLDFSNTNKAESFVHIFIFLTLCGALLNTFMFNPTKDKYYAMILMRMDAKTYTLSNYLYMLLKVLIGLMPFTITFGLMVNVPLSILITMPVFTIMIKAITSALFLFRYKKTKKATNENLPDKLMWIIIGILLVISYGVPYMGYSLNYLTYLFLLIISIIFGIFSFKYIFKFNDYKKVYKQILTPNNVYAATNISAEKILKEQSLKQIDTKNTYTSNKSGFAFFHELFVKRHQKILTKASKRTAFICLIIIIFLIILSIINPNFKIILNKSLLTLLPYMVFVMYIINKGPTVTQAMFMNCDHSMLTYGFYKTPKVILGLFKERLKTLIKINLLPALIIALGLPIILFITGGTDNNLNYLVLFISIISMSIFFSVHYLVMYYLLQPYNVNVEVRSGTYKIVQGLTYFVCYFMLQIKMPIISFGLVAIIFCVLYSVISLYLAYRYAPKTFKLRN